VADTASTNAGEATAVISVGVLANDSDPDAGDTI
jgi:hypothetical protein